MNPDPGRVPAKACFCALLLASLALMGRAQEAQKSREMAFRGAVKVEWVLVPVIVKGPRGYVRGLQAKHFELYVDGRRLEEPDFETGHEAPVSAVILQDLSGSIANGGKLEVSQQILDCLLDRARTGDQVSLATFGSGRLEVQVPPTSDLPAVRQAKGQWVPHGTTALHDAIAWLPDLGASGDSWKHVAILVTDGVDNASALPASTARNLVRQAELPVYVLGLDTGSPFALDPQGRKLYRFADVLNLLAHETGGRYASIRWESEVAAACSAVVDDLRHQYVLSFPTVADGTQAHHKIEVRVRGKRRKVAFRRGYVGGPPSGP